MLFKAASLPRAAPKGGSWRLRGPLAAGLVAAALTGACRPAGPSMTDLIARPNVLTDGRRVAIFCDEMAYARRAGSAKLQHAEICHVYVVEPGKAVLEKRLPGPLWYPQMQGAELYLYGGDPKYAGRSFRLAEDAWVAEALPQSRMAGEVDAWKEVRETELPDDPRERAGLPVGEVRVGLPAGLVLIRYDGMLGGKMHGRLRVDLPALPGAVVLEGDEREHPVDPAVLDAFLRDASTAP